MKPARFLLALSLLQGCHGTQLPNRGLSQADVPTTAQSAAESRAESELPFYLGDRSDSPARDSNHCRIVTCGQDGQKAQLKPQIARPGDFRLEFANLVVDHFTSDHNPYLKARVQTGIINHRHPAVLSTLDSQGTSTVTIHHQQIININEVESRIENQRGITCTSQVADQLQQAMPSWVSRIIQSSPSKALSIMILFILFWTSLAALLRDPTQCDRHVLHT
ncbi:hypothetical protein PGT21_004527 [Puccinia graminis f. sp. tritici]|uniref:Uncharacterized protein n=1 Tax=Puccinia graminis f. sp. tritici TaxID=56615 RepID=A0A5B0LYC3_PUCGR|nr:hypothetical protein PGT21_004527 [Puccinia graminis f. sp. tritici]